MRPIVIQSFELSNLADLRQQFGVSSPLILLTSAHGAPYDLASAGDPTSYADLAAARGLRSISGIVNGIGPDKSQIIARNTGGWPDMMCGWSMTLSCRSWGATV